MNWSTSVSLHKANNMSLGVSEDHEKLLDNAIRDSEEPEDESEPDVDLPPPLATSELC